MLMQFDEQQQRITITTPEDGVHDVLICTNEKEIEVDEADFGDNELGEVQSEKRTAYQYDGNLFRTFNDITEDDINSDIDYYLAYEGDEKPTPLMTEYADKMMDELVSQLIEGGII
jgi:hypothetical protein